MPKTYIIGHQKPDTDAVVASMALEYLYKNCNCFCHENPHAVICDPLNPETKFLFKKFNVVSPKLITSATITKHDKVILVDHNEVNQRFDGMNEDQIVEIVDHHKVNLNLAQPIFLTFKAWGSSSTIVYFLMKQNGVKPDKKLASLMLAAILSDTVGFKSSTSTDKDKELSKELADIAQINDLNAFALEIFKAKSDISSLSDEQIVKNDYKIFEFGKKTMIDQLETVEQSMVLTKKKASLLEAMQNVKTDLAVDLLFVAITDILQVNTKLLILSDAEKDVAQKAFGGKVIDGVLDIGQKMSRKKEIAPAIEATLK
ncbi:MAG: manganese-dependent inorganic pyrophosphatase [Pseudomonadales bacterium]|nr:manganese-dependent inorganic pyrophosphatase [Pseudomonadales bacterium]